MTALVQSRTKLEEKILADRMNEQPELVNTKLTSELKQCVQLSKEKGSSSWLSVLPLEEHGLYSHKREFRDALCLRYGWKLNNTPQTCSCGTQFTVNHAMICHMGGFPTIRHNEIRDITASPLCGENMTARSANIDDGARKRLLGRLSGCTF